MKKLLGIFVVLSLMTSCATTELAIEDNCEEENIGFLTVTNASTDASMDLYIEGTYLVTLSPQANHFVDNIRPGQYEIEGRESNGIRMWLRDVDVLNCEETLVNLGQ